ncbi:MAG: hypothetical protein C0603_05230 [Denitrovibrio sp.]|nr:MAG: hypothetical protein C0603_05230 [Denitrovibrio sp.]
MHQKTQDQNATLELAFDNCHFHGDIEVTQGENIETRFTNKCVFDKNTLIKNSSNKASKAVFYQATFNGFTQFTIPTLELENCIFNNNISSIQSNCKSRLCHFNAPIESIKGSFHDEGSTFQADITINASNSSEHKLTNSKFNDQVTNISEKAKVEFNKCTISDLQYCHSGNKLIIKGGSARKIDIRAGENSKNNFYNIDIHIDSIETLSIRNFKHDPTRPYSESISEISPNIRIKKCSNYIFIYNTAITNGFKLIVDETKGLLFHKSLFFSESVLMISKVNSQLSFNHCTLGNNLLITSESINESAVNTLLLRHIKLTDTAEVVIKNIKIDNLYFNEVLNYSKFFKFSNISINDVLKIEDSLIPELYLSGVSITDQCMEITFSDTSFMNVSFNNVIWPKNLEKIFNTEVAPESNRDTCRQLKKVLENQGNIIDSNRFYALEMKAYGKMLPKSWFTKHIRDKFIFWLGEKTSNFAQDWTKPIYWMLMLACYNLLFSAVVKCEHLQLLNKTFALSSATVMPLLLIILLIYGLKKIPEPVYSLLTLATIVGVTFGIYGYTFVSENFFTSYILYPLERLLAVFNPLDKKSTEGHPILWFFSKAIFAFLIYQFVVATRRQTKR